MFLCLNIIDRNLNLINICFITIRIVNNNARILLLFILQINKKIYLNNSNRICYKFNNFKNKKIKLFLNNVKIKFKIVKLCF